ncbi:TPA: hypothetical protein ACWSRY_003172 [Escherichia coli]
MMVEHDCLTPGEKVKIGNKIFTLRYITRHGAGYTYYFSPGNEKLNPLVENDVVVLSIDHRQSVMFEVIPE